MIDDLKEPSLTNDLVRHTQNKLLHFFQMIMHAECIAFKMATYRTLSFGRRAEFDWGYKNGFQKKHRAACFTSQCTNTFLLKSTDK